MVLGEYDVAVIGGGHAGCEAALAAARLGMKTVMFSISLDAIGNLPCNPSIGGTAKGHLVRELDALGGEMGKAADASFIQSKMLNKGKGPAVHSLRAQIDRKKYHVEMKKRVENQENLQVKQAEIVNVITDEDNNVTEVVTHTGVEYKVKAVIIASGTYLKGKILIGSYSRESGPDGMFPANELSENLRRLGIELKRFKTGTPARVHADTLDYSKMELEEGDEKIVPFSFETENVGKNLVPCYLVYTNEKTHQIIHDNLGRSAMYGGMVVRDTVRLSKIRLCVFRKSQDISFLWSLWELIQRKYMHKAFQRVCLRTYSLKCIEVLRDLKMSKLSVLHMQ